MMGAFTVTALAGLTEERFFLSPLTADRDGAIILGELSAILIFMKSRKASRARLRKADRRSTFRMTPARGC